MDEEEWWVLLRQRPHVCHTAHPGRNLPQRTCNRVSCYCFNWNGGSKDCLHARYFSLESLEGGKAEDLFHGLPSKPQWDGHAAGLPRAVDETRTQHHTALGKAGKDRFLRPPLAVEVAPEEELGQVVLHRGHEHEVLYPRVLGGPGGADRGVAVHPLHDRIGPEGPHAGDGPSGARECPRVAGRVKDVAFFPFYCLQPGWFIIYFWSTRSTHANDLAVGVFTQGGFADILPYISVAPEHNDLFGGSF
mmetsp:Transcript_44676/g.79044  ORF Transcript_44676/g.79044 Transcript_44676/m.79044 type:complete len:247 (+) Transcript_44676:677-1417(+)